MGRQSKSTNITSRLGYGDGRSKNLVPNPNRMGNPEASCLFHQGPLAVKRNFAAVAVKKFKPFKWFKSLPGSINPGNSFSISPSTTDIWQVRDAKFTASQIFLKACEMRGKVSGALLSADAERNVNV